MAITPPRRMIVLQKEDRISRLMSTWTMTKNRQEAAVKNQGVAVKFFEHRLRLLPLSFAENSGWADQQNDD